MGKPSIGDATTLKHNEKKREIRELTVLRDHSKESIYNLIFNESQNGSSKRE